MAKITLNTDKKDINSTICKLNVLFGNSPIETWEAGWDTTIKSQISNMWDEIAEELAPAMKENDRTEILDAYGDIITFLYGVSFYTGGTLLHGTNLHLAPEESTMTKEEKIDLIMDYYDAIMTAFDEYVKGEDEERVELFANFVNSAYDFLFQLNELPIMYDFDPHEVLARVTESNLTKFCSTDGEAHETMSYYEDLGVETYYKEVFVDGNTSVFVVYSSKEQTDINGKMYRANKFLKNQGTFTLPDFSDL